MNPPTPDTPNRKMTPRIEIWLETIIGDSASIYQWKRNHNTALEGIPNDIIQEPGGEEKIFHYLVSRSGIGR